MNQSIKQTRFLTVGAPIITSSLRKATIKQWQNNSHLSCTPSQTALTSQLCFIQFQWLLGSKQALPWLQEAFLRKESWLPPQHTWDSDSILPLQGSSQPKAAPGPIAPALQHHPSLSLKLNNKIATKEVKLRLLTKKKESNGTIIWKQKHF